jgi:hypothetical protein
MLGRDDRSLIFNNNWQRWSQTYPFPDRQTLPRKDQDLLRTARDRVVGIPVIRLSPGLLG